MRHLAALIGVVLTFVLAPSALAYPPGPFAPWDGATPFNCEIQDAGTGVAFPDPGADPFCVEYDKTQQNVTDLGIFDFALNEPARVAQALGKCFYYQSDHWTGSIVQGEEPELWHWDGQYLIDRGLGVGGGNLQNLRVLGVPLSPSLYFPIPPEFAPYVDQDGVGAWVILDLPIDPTCAAKVDTPEERAEVYGPAGPPPAPGAGSADPAAGGSSGVAATGKSKRCRSKKRSGGTRALKRCKKKKRR